MGTMKAQGRCKRCGEVQGEYVDKEELLFENCI